MGLDGSGHPTLYRRMHEHKELIADNPSGMALLPSPHNFSSNPGFIDNAADATSSAYDSAKKAVLGAAKTVSDKVSYAKDAYKSTMQEYKSQIPNELTTTGKSYADNQKEFDKDKGK
jgi:hypothetical protein